MSHQEIKGGILVTIIKDDGGWIDEHGGEHNDIECDLIVALDVAEQLIN